MPKYNGLIINITYGYSDALTFITKCKHYKQFTQGGRKETNIDVVTYCNEVAKLGAGEILGLQTSLKLVVSISLVLVSLELVRFSLELERKSRFIFTLNR